MVDETQWWLLHVFLASVSGFLGFFGIDWVSYGVPKSVDRKENEKDTKYCILLSWNVVYVYRLAILDLIMQISQCMHV
jgi:hypothetical protein